MSAPTIRRLAADILGVGESRVRFEPASIKRIEEALTRDDVRALIKERLVFALPVKGVSRHGARERAEGKRVGRRRGHGSRKGTRNARVAPKDVWMAKVRSQRHMLAGLKAKGDIKPEAVRKVYMMIKGSAFRGKAALATYLKENGYATAAALERPKATGKPASGASAPAKAPSAKAPAPKKQ